MSNGRRNQPTGISRLRNLLDSLQSTKPAATALNVCKPAPRCANSNANFSKQLCKLTGGNRTRAAEMLGVSLRTIRNKIREFGLPPRRYA